MLRNFPCREVSEVAFKKMAKNVQRLKKIDKRFWKSKKVENQKATVNKIIEQSAQDHIRKVLDVQKAIDKGYYHAYKGRHAEHSNTDNKPEDQTNSKSTSSSEEKILLEF